jgi:hypothetical protein
MMAVPCGAAISQSPPAPAATVAPSSTSRTLTLRIDNDAFDFWRMPYNRPDEDYTSGVHITYGGGDAPLWARHFIKGLPSCTTATGSCRTSRVELGQDIYTAGLTSEDPKPPAGSRPSAGWLYLSDAARVLTARRVDELDVSIGVTGRPSLGEFTQTLVHRLAPAYNRPTDWSNQVGFEPGLIVRYEQRRRAEIVSNEPIGWDFIPRFGASVGNVSTEADVGFQTRIGWMLAHPWLPETPKLRVAILAGASEKAVARDLFLDGNTFPSGEHVGHEPFVTSGELSVELRYQWLMLTYRAQSDSRAYSRGPVWHPWASLVGGVTFDR